MLVISFLACSNEEVLNSNEEVLQKSNKEKNNNLQGRFFLTPSGSMPCTDASEICDSSNLPFGSDPYYFFGPNTFHGVIYTNDPRKAVVIDFIYEYDSLGKPKLREFSVVAYGLKMKINMKHFYITEEGYVRVQYMGNYSYTYEAIESQFDEDYGGLEVNLDSLSTVFSDAMINPVNTSAITEYHIFYNTFSVDLNMQSVY